MDIVAKDLFSALIEVREMRKKENLPPDPILEEMIEDFHPTAHGCARDARWYFRENNINVKIKR